MLSPQEAWSKIRASCLVLPEVEVPLAAARGCVLAETVLADRDQPPADRSAMDGFAVRAADLSTLPARLRVIGEVAAGSADAPAVLPGTCVRIFTGANVPDGADAVVKVEDTRALDGAATEFLLPIGARANIFQRGENARKGDTLVSQGHALGAMHIGVCATAGRTHVRIRRRPRVAIIATGRELLAPGAKTGPHQERDSNSSMLEAAIEAAGFAITSMHRISDDVRIIEESLRACLAQADAVVLSGGASVGKYDFVPAVVRKLGADLLVHGVAMKPGKPFLFAVAAGGVCVFGLPGNPLSAATCLHEFVLPALRHMSGKGEQDCRPVLHARLRAALASKPGRQRFALATVGWTAAGPEVEPVDCHSSADLAAGAKADGVIMVPADADGLAAGSVVAFRPWRSWP